METKNYFFSIVIPAHNEEKYITETLEHIKKLEYPKNAFEAVVIENGSTDKTVEVAQKSAGENISVIVFDGKGVSKAKNFGLTKISPQSDWIVFLDADTILEKTFLRDLNDFLQKNTAKNFAIGTTSVKPLENKDWYARLWMWVYDMGHKYTQTSLAIQIMNAKMIGKAQFDPGLSLAEDLKFIRDLVKFGTFFYFNTDTVLTSTRRFEKIGWVTLFVKWNWDAIVWKLKGTKKDYPAIR
jgi:glycosyltransferase involved in cell wall biosynthesis